MKAIVSAVSVSTLFALFAACGGQVGSPLTVPPDGGTQLMTSPDGAVCVDVELSSYDTSCITDIDCMAIDVGQICQGTCFGCASNTAVNVSGQARYQAATEPLENGQTVCACPATSTPRCGQTNQCILCPVDPDAPNQPPGCLVASSDAGGDDGGFEQDGGFQNDDTSGDDTGIQGDDSGIQSDGGAPNCVEVQASSFDVSCNEDSDCTTVLTGAVCDGTCDCGGNTAINVAGQGQWDQDVSGITFDDCPCAESAPPVCASGACATCTGNPSDPPECATHP